MHTSPSPYRPKDLGVPGPVVIDDVPWLEVELEFGISQTKLLRVCVRENWSTSLIRWKAGLTIPTHRHFGPVHAHTLSGRWHYKEYDWFATAGSYLVETPETEHSLVVDEDTEAIFTTFGGFVDIGPNGELYRYHDAQKTLDLIVEALGAKGLKLPPGVVIS